MPRISSAILKDAATGFRALFQEGLQGAKPHHTEFVDVYPSTGALEEYIFPAATPQMHEWKSERERRAVKVFEQSLKNRKFANTLTIPREAFEDDKLGVYSGQIRQIGLRAKMHPDKLWVELMEGGFTAAGYDGEPFYSTSHPRRGSLADQSNLLTKALDEDSFNEGVETLMSITDFEGEPIEADSMGGELVLCVPPALRATAKEIVEAERNAAGATNINFKAARVKVISRLTSDVKWYLHWLVPAGRPFMLQSRTEAEFVMRMNPDDPSVFDNDEYLYGARRRYAMGYQWFELSLASTGVD